MTAAKSTSVTTKAKKTSLALNKSETKELFKGAIDVALFDYEQQLENQLVELDNEVNELKTQIDKLDAQIVNEYTDYYLGHIKDYSEKMYNFIVKIRKECLDGGFNFSINHYGIYKFNTMTSTVFRVRAKGDFHDISLFGISVEKYQHDSSERDILSKKIQEITNKEYKIGVELRNLPKAERRIRAQLVRTSMESSKEGKSVLDMARLALSEHITKNGTLS